MVNALFVLIVFLLQLNKDNLHFKWPFGVKTNITYDEVTQEVTWESTTQRSAFNDDSGLRAAHEMNNVTPSHDPSHPWKLIRII